MGSHYRDSALGPDGFVGWNCNWRSLFQVSKIWVAIGTIVTLGIILAPH